MGGRDQFAAADKMTKNISPPQKKGLTFSCGREEVEESRGKDSVDV